MRTWFASRDGAITVAAVALLSFVGYTLMEMRYYLAKWIPGDGPAAAETVAIVLMVGAWLWALIAARDGRRGGLTTLLALCGFSVLTAVYDLQYALAPAMSWPERSAVFVLLAVGVIATATLGARWRSSRKA